MFTYGILTISDKASIGLRKDIGGQTIADRMNQFGFILVERETVPDDVALISGTLRRWATALDLILTTGGTGLNERDVTPEATTRVLDRQAPGLSELLRSETSRVTPLAALSRGVSGTRGRCLIINLPGSPKAVHEYLELLIPILPHAVETMRGPVEDHPDTQYPSDTGF